VVILVALGHALDLICLPLIRTLLVFSPLLKGRAYCLDIVGYAN
jgi:hypothetical protein